MMGSQSHRTLQVIENLERETGIEPATNSLEGCDSTTELLPPCYCKVVHLLDFSKKSGADGEA